MRASLKGLANALLQSLPGPASRAARRAYYGRLLRAAREDAQVDLAFLKRVVRRGDCVVDAGASIGLYTKFLSALVGPEGLVYSVEPVPETYDVLVANVRRLGLSNVRPLNYALSDVDGELEMEVPRWSYGGENLYEARVAGAASGGLRRIRVASRRLDALVGERPIAFVKCDVEGHELRCLEGAPETIRRWRPAWLLEVWGDPDAEGSDARRVFLAMQGLGYAAYCWDGRWLASRTRGRRTDNYWFLTAEQARYARRERLGGRTTKRGADPAAAVPSPYAGRDRVGGRTTQRGADPAAAVPSPYVGRDRVGGQGTVGGQEGCGTVAPAMPICIAGMHRAGTSMVARMLEGCGVDLGGTEHFAPPAPDNRDGYWEDLRFVALNDRILEKFQGAWDHPPVLPPGWEASADLEQERRDAAAILRWRAEAWGWKDPRNSLTIPFWRSLLPTMRVIVCLRNPFEVAASLRARGYTSERFGLSLWEAYHRAIEETVDSSFGLVTHYESFLADPKAELERVLAFLELQPSPAVLEAVLASALPGARHHRRTSAEAEAATWSAAGRALYAALCERSGPVYAEVQRRELVAPPPPATPQEAGPRSHAEQLAEVLAVLEARDAELASIKPVLVARNEEVDGLKTALAARDEHLASVLPALAARDEEIASLKGALADREHLLGSLKGVLTAVKKGARSAIKRLVAPVR